MIVDLNPMPFTKAIYIIRWCYARDIDKDKCAELLSAMKSRLTHDNEPEWCLNIPDKYMTWLEMEDL